MPQIQLPIFPSNSTPITSELAFQERGGTVWYFNGHLPVFSHPVEDLGSFRFFTSQLIANGNDSQGEISRAFGVPLVSVKRACKKMREQGAAGFFRPAEPQQGHRLTAERLAEVQERLDAGMSVPAIGVELGVLANTIHKAIRAGRLKKKRCQPEWRIERRRGIGFWSKHPGRAQRGRWRGFDGSRHHSFDGTRGECHGGTGSRRDPL